MFYATDPRIPSATNIGLVMSPMDVGVTIEMQILPGKIKMGPI